MADFWDSEELLGKFVKNSREEIQVKKVTKNSKAYVDIRTFWFDSKSDEYRPSQKGVAIPMEFVGELLSILENVEE
ncbi:MAG: transcriptional coactivator p15 [Clostridiaceae bacterium]|nr:transcriptional coactivator p15 [Clostridiaceae bacterium]